MSVAVPTYLWYHGYMLLLLLWLLALTLIVADLVVALLKSLLLLQMCH